MSHDYQPHYEEYNAPRKIGAVRWVLTLVILGILAAIGFFYFTGIIQFYYVESGSMEPTLQVGDRILIDGSGVYDRFDIVAFVPPGADEPYVKRIIGLGGDEIEIRGGIIYINGEEQYSRFIRGNRINWKDIRVKLKYDEVFVLGDNRNDSEDSLNFGPVKTDKLRGVLTYILWPKSRWGKVKRIDELEEEFENGE